MEKTLDQLAREERKEYFKIWRAKNKDKSKKYNAAYWEKRAQKKRNQ